MLTPDGASVLYLAEQAVDGRFELWLVPLDGSAASRRLNEPLIPLGDVSEYALDPTDTWALYLADQDHDEERGLYAVPLDGSASPRNLGPQFSPATAQRRSTNAREAAVATFTTDGMRRPAPARVYARAVINGGSRTVDRDLDRGGPSHGSLLGVRARAGAELGPGSS
ncbi:MAG: hypothetical protein EXS08_06445 [Planctomycetes bacterium]|nr:hypothetical protein [Planctomycetota bacterium]